MKFNHFGERWSCCGKFIVITKIHHCEKKTSFYEHSLLWQNFIIRIHSLRNNLDCVLNQSFCKNTSLRWKFINWWLFLIVILILWGFGIVIKIHFSIRIYICDKESSFWWKIITVKQSLWMKLIIVLKVTFFVEFHYCNENASL